MDRLFNTITLRLFPQRTLLFRSRTTGLEKARIMNMKVPMRMIPRRRINRLIRNRRLSLSPLLQV